MEITGYVPERPPHDLGDLGGGGVDWTLREVLFGALWFLAIFFGGQFLVLPLAFVYGAESGQLYTAAFVIGGAVEVGIAIVAANFTYRRYGGGLGRLGIRPITGRTLLWALAAFIGALIGSTIYGVIVTYFDIGWLQTDCAEQIPRGVRDNRALLALASLTVIAFAPVCEELFFRGFLFPGLARGWGLAAGVVISGLLFASAHLLYKSFVPIAIVGIVFAYTYYRSKNIFSTMMAHVAFNSLSIAFIAGGSCNTSSTSISIAHLWLPF